MRITEIMELKSAAYTNISIKYEEQLVNEFITFLDNYDIYINYIIAMNMAKSNVNKSNIHIYISKILFSEDKDLRKMFRRSFIWASTEEGYEFWRTAEIKWIDYITVLLKKGNLYSSAKKTDRCDSIW